MAAFNRNSQKERLKNLMSDTKTPRINEDYCAQVSEENGDRMTKKISQELSNTESRILSALSKIDEFFPNSQFLMQSGTFHEFPKEPTKKSKNVTSTVTRMVVILMWLLQ